MLEAVEVMYVFRAMQEKSNLYRQRVRNSVSLAEYKRRHSEGCERKFLSGNSKARNRTKVGH